MDFTLRQQVLVNSSWEAFNQNLPLFSVLFCSFILEKAPATQNMFPILKNANDEPLNNPSINAHAEKVFEMVRDAAAQLRTTGEVILEDATLGAVHTQKRIAGRHFMVVKEALLKTVKEAAGYKWSEELSNAWEIAYDGLAVAIMKEMS